MSHAPRSRPGAAARLRPVVRRPRRQHGLLRRSLGLHTVRGSFPVVDGIVEVDGSGRPVSVRATLDARGATGNPRRDRDLAGPRFLAADGLADPELHQPAAVRRRSGVDGRRHVAGAGRAVATDTRRPAGR